MRKKVLNPRPGHKNIDITGIKSGKLTVIKYSHLGPGKNKMWECLCECGNTTFQTTTVLRQFREISCGCSSNKNKRGAEVYNYSGYKGISGTKWNNLTSNASARGLVVAITKEFVWDMLIVQDNKCAISGLSISFEDKTASVDRIDNSIGYLENNIQIVHKEVNMLRGKLGVNRFIELCKIVSDYNKNKKIA